VLGRRLFAVVLVVVVVGFVVIVVVVVVALVVSRWLLVLFSRDFQHIDDVVRLWDGLFADGLDLDLIDYIFIAILLFLKDDRMYDLITYSL